MEKIELLAPVGDEKTFYASIKSGADAVYLGGKRFGARKFANNFDYEEMIDLLVIGFEESLFYHKELKSFISSLTRDKVKNVALVNMFYFSEKSMDKAINLCHIYDLPLLRETYSCKRKRLLPENHLTDDIISGGREYVEDMINICNNYY